MLSARSPARQPGCLTGCRLACLLTCLPACRSAICWSDRRQTARATLRPSDVPSTSQSHSGGLSVRQSQSVTQKLGCSVAVCLRGHPPTRSLPLLAFVVALVDTAADSSDRFGLTVDAAGVLPYSSRFARPGRIVHSSGHSAKAAPWRSSEKKKHGPEEAPASRHTKVSSNRIFLRPRVKSCFRIEYDRRRYRFGNEKKSGEFSANAAFRCGTLPSALISSWSSRSTGFGFLDAPRSWRVPASCGNDSPVVGCPLVTKT